MEEKNVEIDNKNEKQIEIIKIGKFSFELEEKREQSLIMQSGHMLTGFSIISVMLLAVIPILLDYTKISNKTVFLLLGIPLLCLVIGLLFAIAAQWRYDIHDLGDLESTYELIMNGPLVDVNKWWLANLNYIYKKRLDLNEKRAKSMILSTAFFGISILTILIYLIALLTYAAYKFLL